MRGGGGKCAGGVLLTYIDTNKFPFKKKMTSIKIKSGAPWFSPTTPPLLHLA